MEPISLEVIVTFAPIAMQLPKRIKGVGGISTDQEILKLWSDGSCRKLIAAFAAGVWLYAEIAEEPSNGN